MATLTSSLLNAANSMQVFTESLNTIENNITNANTPGYAAQDQLLVAQPFDPSTGATGGVEAGPLISSRSDYLEQQVWNQSESLGYAQQQSNDLNEVQPLFDLTSTTGIASDLNNFFNSFSQLSISPNDTISRQAVIQQATALAQNINGSANTMNQTMDDIASQTTDVVGNINQIASQIAAINQQYQSNANNTQDAGLSAQMYTALENLSSLANFTVLKQPDGTFTVLLGGQTPLVMGSQQFQISANTSSQTSILDSNGNDITSEITQGQLGALIQDRNTTIPGYLNTLNTFAQSLADTVNGQLNEGVDENGNAPTTDLFSYDQPSDAAETIAVTGITPDQIAAASSDAPGGNGNAIALAQLATAPSVNGYSFTQYYGNLGTQVGNDVSSAQQNQTQFQDQLTQAQAARANQDGVSLNTEAAMVLQFQQAYQAAGQLVSILNSMTQTVITMVSSTTA
ncbi:MAG TPA: flagellar hook-associated protein FlgK [Bryobacteraceae bacterium]|nr:flagellar hook-associated protein FlgK [Bryobacteraceae bacterium]